jgi:hypothetical protein
VETPSPSNSPHDHMLLRVELVDPASLSCTRALTRVADCLHVGLAGADVDLMVRGGTVRRVLLMSGMQKQDTMLQLCDALVSQGAAAAGSVLALAFARVPLVKFDAAPPPHVPEDTPLPVDLALVADTDPGEVRERPHTPNPQRL